MFSYIVTKILIFEYMDNQNLEHKKLSIDTFIIPSIVILILVLIKWIEIKTSTSFSFLGVYPQELKGVPGIIFSPFIHADVAHLFNNVIPLFFLLSAMKYFYGKLSYLIYPMLHIGTGLLLLLMAAQEGKPHIGASGVVYSLASFMFFSGVFKKNTQLLAFSLLITFLYGSMFWGVFEEYVADNVSWEAHRSGALIGLICSVIFIKKGPQRKKYEWDEDNESNEVIYTILKK